MSALSLSPTRRELLAATAAAAAISLLPGALRAAGTGDPIRPFTVNIPQREITERRQRIAATQWPDPATVADTSQGERISSLLRFRISRPHARIDGRYQSIGDTIVQ